MPDDEENFEKIFSEIINSNDLKDISESFDKKNDLDIKELLLIQQSLLDAVSHINDVLISLNKNEDHKILESENEAYEVMCSLYKISEDFNDCMVEYYQNIDDDDEGDVCDTD